MGVRVSASNKDKRTAAVIVTPNWKKYFPMIPFMKVTGRKIETMERVAAKAAKVISLIQSVLIALC